MHPLARLDQARRTSRALALIAFAQRCRQIDLFQRWWHMQVAIAGTLLTASGSNVDASSYATASITPSANVLVLAAVNNQRATATAPEPTATGNSLTYVSVATRLHQVGTNVDRCRITLFRAMGASPSAGAITFDFASDTQLTANWVIAEFSGVDTGGTNGSAAVLQPTTEESTTSVTGLLVTLGAFGNAANGTYGAFSHPVNEDKVQGSGFTLLGNGKSGTPQMCVGAEWKATNDTTVEMQWPGNVRCAGIAVELKAAAAATLRYYVSDMIAPGTEPLDCHHLALAALTPVPHFSAMVPTDGSGVPSFSWSLALAATIDWTAVEADSANNTRLFDGAEGNAIATYAAMLSTLAGITWVSLTGGQRTNITATLDACGVPTGSIVDATTLDAVLLLVLQKLQPGIQSGGSGPRTSPFQ